MRLRTWPKFSADFSQISLRFVRIRLERNAAWKSELGEVSTALTRLMKPLFPVGQSAKSGQDAPPIDQVEIVGFFEKPDQGGRTQHRRKCPQKKGTLSPLPPSIHFFSFFYSEKMEIALHIFRLVREKNKLAKTRQKEKPIFSFWAKTTKENEKCISPQKKQFPPLFIPRKKTPLFPFALLCWGKEQKRFLEQRIWLGTDEGKVIQKEKVTFRTSSFPPRCAPGFFFCKFLKFGAHGIHGTHNVIFFATIFPPLPLFLCWPYLHREI